MTLDFWLLFLFVQLVVDFFRFEKYPKRKSSSCILYSLCLSYYTAVFYYKTTKKSPRYLLASSSFLFFLIFVYRKPDVWFFSVLNPNLTVTPEIKDQFEIWFFSVLKTQITVFIHSLEISDLSFESAMCVLLHDWSYYGDVSFGS